MKVAFYCEHGQTPEVGTGHYWRSKAISSELEKRGHKTSFVQNDIVVSGPNVMVVDHVHSKKDIILRAKSAGMKVLLIDGHEDDMELVDASVSAIYNPESDYTGVKYMAFSKCPAWTRYNPQKKSSTVFVGMGGFDAQNLAELVLPIIKSLGLYAIVTKSNNHPNFKDKFNNVEIFEEENYYDAMHECIIGITNGGLTLYQALHYGLPCVALAQYEHQRRNIEAVSIACLTAANDPFYIEKQIEHLMESEYRRESMSVFAQKKVDGKGIDRICKIIEELV